METIWWLGIQHFLIFNEVCKKINYQILGMVLDDLLKGNYNENILFFKGI